MNKQRTLIGGTVVIITFALIGFLALRSSPAPQNTASNNPSNTGTSASVMRAWQRLLDSKGAHITSSLNMNLPHTTNTANNQPIVAVAIVTEGDGIWREKPQYSGVFRIETSGRGMQLFTDGEILILPDITMFKLQNLPALINPTGNLLNKWTSVEGSLLRVKNPEEVFPTLTSLFDGWNQIGQSTFEKNISEEEAKRLESAFQIQSSESRALNIAARLLRNFTVKNAQAQLREDQRELQSITFRFASKQEPTQQATLAFSFKDLGKQVSIDVPEAESSVKPEVFARLFGEAQQPTPTTTLKR